MSVADATDRSIVSSASTKSVGAEWNATSVSLPGEGKNLGTISLPTPDGKRVVYALFVEKGGKPIGLDALDQKCDMSKVATLIQAVINSVELAPDQPLAKQLPGVASANIRKDSILTTKKVSVSQPLERYSPTNQEAHYQEKYRELTSQFGVSVPEKADTAAFPPATPSIVSSSDLKPIRRAYYLQQDVHLRPPTGKAETPERRSSSPSIGSSTVKAATPDRRPSSPSIGSSSLSASSAPPQPQPEQEILTEVSALAKHDKQRRTSVSSSLAMTSRVKACDTEEELEGFIQQMSGQIDTSLCEDREKDRQKKVLRQEAQLRFIAQEVQKAQPNTPAFVSVLSKAIKSPYDTTMEMKQLADTLDCVYKHQGQLLSASTKETRKIVNAVIPTEALCTAFKSAMAAKKEALAIKHGGALLTALQAVFKSYDQKASSSAALQSSSGSTAPTDPASAYATLEA